MARLFFQRCGFTRSLVFSLFLFGGMLAASAGEAAGRASARQVEMSITVIDPCLNSHNLNDLRCTGTIQQKVTESMEMHIVRTPDGQELSGMPEQSFVVRTIDFF